VTAALDLQAASLTPPVVEESPDPVGHPRVVVAAAQHHRYSDGNGGEYRHESG